MLLRLKISIHDVETASPEVPKGSPDHNLQVPLCIVGLDHLLAPFLRRRAEDPFVSFAPPPNKTPTAPHPQSPILCSPVPSFEAPGKPLRCIRICKKRAAFSLPMGDVVLLEDLPYSFLLHVTPVPSLTCL